MFLIYHATKLLITFQYGVKKQTEIDKKTTRRFLAKQVKPTKQNHLKLNSDEWIEISLTQNGDIENESSEITLQITIGGSMLTFSTTSGFRNSRSNSIERLLLGGKNADTRNRRHLEELENSFKGILNYFSASLSPVDQVVEDAYFTAVIQCPEKCSTCLTDDTNQPTCTACEDGSALFIDDLLYLTGTCGIYSRFYSFSLFLLLLFFMAFFVFFNFGIFMRILFFFWLFI